MAFSHAFFIKRVYLNDKEPSSIEYLSIDLTL